MKFLLIKMNLSFFEGKINRYQYDCKIICAHRLVYKIPLSHYSIFPIIVRNLYFGSWSLMQVENKRYNHWG